MNENDEQRMKNKMEFIVEQQARIDANLQTLTTNVNGLTANVNALTIDVGELTTNVRQAIGALVIANEETRNLAVKSAQLAIAIHDRLSDHLDEAKP